MLGFQVRGKEPYLYTASVVTFLGNVLEELKLKQSFWLTSSTFNNLF